MESVIINFQDWLDNIRDEIVDDVSGSDVNNDMKMWKIEKRIDGYGLRLIFTLWGALFLCLISLVEAT